MKNEISLNEAKKRIYKKHGSNIEIIEYINITNFAKFKCNICGHIWKSIPKKVCKGIGCFICYKNKNKSKNNNGAFSFDYVKEFIESLNCKLLSDEYKNNRAPLKIQFECGHVANVSFGSFKEGSRCRICQLEKLKVCRKYSMDRINKIMDENNLHFVSFPNGYKNRNSIIEFSCDEGHISSVTFGSFLRKSECYVCSREKMIESISGKNASNWKGGTTELKDYLAKRILNWKNKSVEDSDGKCIISGNPYDDIHHIYSFNLIIQESICELNFKVGKTISEYDTKDIKKLVKKVQEIHKKYPLGVCLTTGWHKKFHDMYGYGDTTPKMWYEFFKMAKSGEIILPE